MHKLRGYRDLFSYMDAGYLGNTKVVRVRLSVASKYNEGDWGYLVTFGENVELCLLMNGEFKVATKGGTYITNEGEEGFRPVARIPEESKRGYAYDDE